MKIKLLTLSERDYPEILRHIPSPPKQLYCAGAPLLELLKRPRVAIVGSRDMSIYGQRVTTEIAGRLAEQGVVIVSGLAMGVDGTAHQAALDRGGAAIAVLPTPLDDIRPTINQRLAEAIIDSGGALVSEYASGQRPYKQNFIARNRIMSGLANIVLITEAGEKSGAIHTANFALEQGKTVLAVPGSIYQTSSVGTNNLLKTGATPVTSYIDVLHCLGLTDHQTPQHRVKGRNANEQLVLDLMLRGISDADELLTNSRLTTSEFNRVLTMLELSSKIRSLGANQWAVF